MTFQGWLRGKGKDGKGNQAAGWAGEGKCKPRLRVGVDMQRVQGQA